MADILDAAQTNPQTSSTPPVADTPLGGAPVDPTTPVPPIAPEPPTESAPVLSDVPSSDSLIVPPPEEPKPEAPLPVETPDMNLPTQTSAPQEPEPPAPSSEAPSGKPKKKFKPAILIAGILLFLLLPLTVVFVQQQQEIRSRAALSCPGGYVCSGCPGKPSFCNGSVSKPATKTCEQARGDCSSGGPSTGVGSVTGTAGSATCGSAGQAPKSQGCCSGTTLVGGLCVTKTTPKPTPKTCMSSPGIFIAGACSTSERCDITSGKCVPVTTLALPSIPPSNRSCSPACPTGQTCRNFGGTHSCQSTNDCQNKPKPNCGCQVVCDVFIAGVAASWRCPTNCPGSPPTTTPSTQLGCSFTPNECGTRGGVIDSNGCCQKKSTTPVCTPACPSQLECVRLPGTTATYGCRPPTSTVTTSSTGLLDCGNVYVSACTADDVICDSSVDSNTVCGKNKACQGATGYSAACPNWDPSMGRGCEPGYYPCSLGTKCCKIGKVPEEEKGGGTTTTGTGGSQCVNIQVYKGDTLVTSAELPNLKNGDAVKLTYGPGAGATKARLRVNSSNDADWQETTTKNGSGAFTWDYTLSGTSFTIQAQYFDGTNWH